MKKFVQMALMSGIPFGIFQAWMNNDTPQKAISIGLFSAVFFGSSMAGLFMYSAKKLIKSIQVNLNENESVVKESGANHWIGAEAVGGKLVLTNHRLIFKSHRLNIQNHEQSFQFEDLKDIKTGKMLGFTSALLFSYHNVGHKFVIDEVKDWEALLKERLALK